MKRQDAAYNHLDQTQRIRVYMRLFILAQEWKKPLPDIRAYILWNIHSRIMRRLPLIQHLMFAIHETSPNSDVQKDGERNMKYRMNEWQNIYEARRNKYNRNCRESFIYGNSCVHETPLNPNTGKKQPSSCEHREDNEKIRSTIWHVAINIAANLFGMHATRGLEYSALDRHTDSCHLNEKKCA